MLRTLSQQLRSRLARTKPQDNSDHDPREQPTATAACDPRAGAAACTSAEAAAAHAAPANASAPPPDSRAAFATLARPTSASAPQALTASARSLAAPAAASSGRDSSTSSRPHLRLGNLAAPPPPPRPAQQRRLGTPPPPPPWHPATLRFACPVRELRFLDWMARDSLVFSLAMHLFYMSVAMTAFTLRCVQQPPPAAAARGWGCAEQREAGVLLPAYPCEAGAGRQALHILAHAAFYYLIRPLRLRDWAILYNVLSMAAATAWLTALVASGANRRNRNQPTANRLRPSSAAGPLQRRDRRQLAPCGRCRPAVAQWAAWLRWRGAVLSATPLHCWVVALPATLVGAGPGAWWRLESYALAERAVREPLWDAAIMVLLQSGLQLRFVPMAACSTARCLAMALLGGYIQVLDAAAATATDGTTAAVAAAPSPGGGGVPPPPQQHTAPPPSAGIPLAASVATAACRNLAALLPLAAAPLAAWWWSERGQRRRFLAMEEAAEDEQGPAASAAATMCLYTAPELHGKLGAAFWSRDGAEPAEQEGASGAGGGGGSSGSRSGAGGINSGARRAFQFMSSSCDMTCSQAPDLQLSAMLSTADSLLSHRSSGSVDGRGSTDGCGGCGSAAAGEGHAARRDFSSAATCHSWWAEMETEAVVGGAGGAGRAPPRTSGGGVYDSSSGATAPPPAACVPEAPGPWWALSDEGTLPTCGEGADANNAGAAACCAGIASGSSRAASRGTAGGAPSAAAGGTRSGPATAAAAEPRPSRCGAPRTAPRTAVAVTAVAAAPGAPAGGMPGAGAGARVEVSAAAAAAAEGVRGRAAATAAATAAVLARPALRGTLHAVPLQRSGSRSAARAAAAAGANAGAALSSGGGGLARAVLGYRSVTRLQCMSVKVHHPTGSHDEYAARLAAAVGPVLFPTRLLPALQPVPHAVAAGAGGARTGGLVVVEGCVQLIAWVRGVDGTLTQQVVELTKQLAVALGLDAASVAALVQQQQQQPPQQGGQLHPQQQGVQMPQGPPPQQQEMQPQQQQQGPQLGMVESSSTPQPLLLEQLQFQPPPPQQQSLFPQFSGVQAALAAAMPDSSHLGHWALQGPTGRVATFEDHRPRTQLPGCTEAALSPAAHNSAAAFGSPAANSAAPGSAAAAALSYASAAAPCSFAASPPPAGGGGGGAYAPTPAHTPAPVPVSPLSSPPTDLELGLTSAVDQPLRLLLVRHGLLLADYSCALGSGEQVLALPVPPQPAPAVLQLVFAPAAGAATPTSPLMYDIATLLAVPPEVAAELAALSQVMRMEYGSAAAAAVATSGATWRDHYAPLISDLAYLMERAELAAAAAAAQANGGAAATDLAALAAAAAADGPAAVLRVAEHLMQYLQANAMPASLAFVVQTAHAALQLHLLAASGSGGGGGGSSAAAAAATDVQGNATPAQAPPVAVEAAGAQGSGPPAQEQPAAEAPAVQQPAVSAKAAAPDAGREQQAELAPAGAVAAGAPPSAAPAVGRLYSPFAAAMEPWPATDDEDEDQGGGGEATAAVTPSGSSLAVTTDGEGFGSSAASGSGVGSGGGGGAWERSGSAQHKLPVGLYSPFAAAMAEPWGEEEDEDEGGAGAGLGGAGGEAAGPPPQQQWEGALAPWGEGDDEDEEVSEGAGAVVSGTGSGEGAPRPPQSQPKGPAEAAATARAASPAPSAAGLKLPAGLLSPFAAAMAPWPSDDEYEAEEEQFYDAIEQQEGEEEGGEQDHGKGGGGGAPAGGVGLAAAQASVQPHDHTSCEQQRPQLVEKPWHGSAPAAAALDTHPRMAPEALKGAAAAAATAAFAAGEAPVARGGSSRSGERQRAATTATTNGAAAASAAAATAPAGAAPLCSAESIPAAPSTPYAAAATGPAVDSGGGSALQRHGNGNGSGHSSSAAAAAPLARRGTQEPPLPGTPTASTRLAAQPSSATDAAGSWLPPRNLPSAASASAAPLHREGSGRHGNAACMAPWGPVGSAGRRQSAAAEAPAHSQTGSGSDDSSRGSGDSDRAGQPGPPAGMGASGQRSPSRSSPSRSSPCRGSPSRGIPSRGSPSRGSPSRGSAECAEPFPVGAMAAGPSSPIRSSLSTRLPLSGAASRAASCFDYTLPEGLAAAKGLECFSDGSVRMDGMGGTQLPPRAGPAAAAAAARGPAPAVLTGQRMLRALLDSCRGYTTRPAVPAPPSPPPRGGAATAGGDQAITPIPSAAAAAAAAALVSSGGVHESQYGIGREAQYGLYHARQALALDGYTLAYIAVKGVVYLLVPYLLRGDIDRADLLLLSLHLLLRILSFAPKLLLLASAALAIARRKLFGWRQRALPPRPPPPQAALAAAPHWAVAWREAWVIYCGYAEMLLVTLPLAMGLLPLSGAVVQRMRGLGLEVLMDGIQRIAFDQVRTWRRLPQHTLHCALLYGLASYRLRLPVAACVLRFLLIWLAGFVTCLVVEVPRRADFTALHATAPAAAAAAAVPAGGGAVGGGVAGGAGAVVAAAGAAGALLVLLALLLAAPRFDAPPPASAAPRRASVDAALLRVQCTGLRVRRSNVEQYDSAWAARLGHLRVQATHHELDMLLSQLDELKVFLIERRPQLIHIGLHYASPLYSNNGR
ncbi:hypothetical protein TSOC_010773 [Tetrabaena socialis]|uniref:Uncharacterized protein n=1 Tax=Tetrabaena socialis TaxID=47790 RepID=A0A2J7ZSC7_9CHLO|nr:hypothetical protein TSOC_010773 [Tetrabaena socialis]|eukprot:PNH03179.1 hypothetical protein TSOC_010773 [Tetrabaena socialis]